MNREKTGHVKGSRTVAPRGYGALDESTRDPRTRRLASGVKRGHAVAREWENEIERTAFRRQKSWDRKDEMDTVRVEVQEIRPQRLTQKRCRVLASASEAKDRKREPERQRI